MLATIFMESCSWDEWITEDRVLKYTDANLQKQKQLKEMNSKRKPSRASSNANISSLHDGTESRSRKRNRDSSTDKVRIVSFEILNVKRAMRLILLGGRGDTT